MVLTSLDNYKATLYTTLEKYSYLFETHSPRYIDQTAEINHSVMLAIPKFGDQSTGLQIVGGGLIRCSETIQIIDRNQIMRKSYSYGFTCDKYSYNCSDGINSSAFPYHFRFEKTPVLQKNHPEHHLQVIHDCPRYYSSELTLDMFLKLIDSLLFNNKIRETLPPWSVN